MLKDNDTINNIKGYIHERHTFTTKITNRSFCEGYFKAFYNMKLITSIEHDGLVVWIHGIYDK